MAYLKIFPIKVTDNKAIDYIMNPDKTDDNLLVSGFHCTPETAALEFAMTREFAKNNTMEKGSNLAWHIVQSFKPGELTDPQIAHEIGQQFADKFLKGKYEFVIATHTDKDHIHNHIILCSASFVDYHKFVANKRSYYRMCKISNSICRQYGLCESMPTQNKNTSYKEQMEFKKGTSWKAKLKFQVDRAIRSSITYDEFLMKMKQAGYEIRQGKYLAFRAEDQKHFTNVKTLGSYYADDKIFERLEKNRHTVKAPKNITPEIRVFIEMTSYVGSQNKIGFERWAQRNNLKEAAKTFNYLSENNLLNYEDFKNHCTEVSESITATKQDLNDIEKEISSTLLLQKHCNNYRYCADIISKEPEDNTQNAYRIQHQNEYKLLKSTQQELSKLGITKIPSTKRINNKLQSLEQQQISKAKDLQSLSKKEKELKAIQTNFNIMLAMNPQKQNNIEKDSPTAQR